LTSRPALPLALLLLGALPSCGGKGTGPSGGGFDWLGDRRSEADVTERPAPTREQVDAAVIGAGERPDAVDTTGGAWRMIDVPGLDTPTIVRSPSGWLALSRGIAGAKVITGAQTALYRSMDGVHWTAIPLRQDDDLAMRWLTYGAGRYLMSGGRIGGGDVLWTSTDGDRWQEQASPASETGNWNELAYAENRFFRFGFSQLALSDDGESWSVVPNGIVQGGSAAYGNGLYLLAGNGPMMTSEDGWRWQERPIDCSLPDACITDPSGRVAQGYHGTPVFAEGRFYSGQLSSADGVAWRVEPHPPVLAHIGDHFFGHPSVIGGLAAWVNGGEARTLRVIQPSREAASDPARAIHRLELGPLPEQLSVEFEDGLTCETATCIALGSTLLLVPPPGTPPLVDRVPRGADGAPLLSHDCPVSSMLSCNDYATREGCICNPSAPRSPEYCEDVSQFRCAGQFNPRENEWPLDELGPGGCDCGAIEPNQPPGFGTTCTPQSDTCQAPLECLTIDPLPSEGPPDIRAICTSPCNLDSDCPSWEATGYCAGPVQLRCSNGSCQPRRCD
jgi:hypothetical protein